MHARKPHSVDLKLLLLLVCAVGLLAYYSFACFLEASLGGHFWQCLVNFGRSMLLANCCFAAVLLLFCCWADAGLLRVCCWAAGGLLCLWLAFDPVLGTTPVGGSKSEIEETLTSMCLS